MPEDDLVLEMPIGLLEAVFKVAVLELVTAAHNELNQSIFDKMPKMDVPSVDNST